MDYDNWLYSGVGGPHDDEEIDDEETEYGGEGKYDEGWWEDE